MQEPANGKKELDTEHMTELFHRHAPSMFAYLRQHTDSREDAEAGALKAIPLRARQVFTQPGNDKVEVYWNGLLATALHFVVEQKA